MTVDAGPWTFLLRTVAEAFSERTDVSLTVIWHPDGQTRVLTIPAGTDLLGLFGNAPALDFAELERLLK